MRKKAAWFLVLASVIALCAAGYAQDTSGEDDIKKVSGTVCAINWVADKLVVRTNDFGETDEITFVVPDNTPVTKAGNNTSLANINISDRVVVEYHRNSFAGLKATSITIKQ